MATKAHNAGSIALQFPGDRALAQLRAALIGLPYGTLADIATLAIERMNELDGDPDLEPNGDEEEDDDPAEDGGDADDSLCFHDPNDQRRMLSRWGWQDADQ